MKQALVFAFAVALHRATGDVPRRRSSLGGAARAGPAPALGACVALRGGAEARALAPDRSPLGRFLAAVRAFVASFFDPAFGGAHAGGAAPEARGAAAGGGGGAAGGGGGGAAPRARAPRGAARTITVDDLKQMEGGRVTAIATEAELGRAVAAKKLSVVDFWAAWRGPRAGVTSSARLPCARVRRLRREVSRRASSTRREPSIRPNIGRIDVDATELERLEVRRGPPAPAVEFHAGAGPACP
jgi:hypothetical protein